MRRINQNLLGRGRNKSTNIAFTGVTKAGYLLKQSNVKNIEWTRFYITLNCHTITYHTTRDGSNIPKGDILLTIETKVTCTDDFTLNIETGNEIMILQGRDDTETRAWKMAIDNSVAMISNLVRGYMIKVKKTGKKRFFFMLHNECITYHPSHDKTTVISGLFHLTETSMAAARGEKELIFHDSNNRSQRWKIISSGKQQQQLWIHAFNRSIRVLQGRDELVLLSIQPESTSANAICSGFLYQRNYTSSLWEDSFFVLGGNVLHKFYQVSREERSTPKQFILTPDTTIHCTILKDFSFEVVTFSDVLHLCAHSEEEKEKWLSALHHQIDLCTYSMDEPLQLAASKRRGIFNDVIFDTKDEPGFILEKKRNWAIVTKVTKSLQQHVPIGSALVAINGTSVDSMAYDSVVGLLSDWRPPLHLCFRVQPKKSGHLLKYLRPTAEGISKAGSSEQASDRPHMPWQQKLVLLTQGRIFIFHEKDKNMVKEEEVCLSAAAVRLVRTNDAMGERFCFRVMSGLDSFLLKASSHDEMIDWATAIVHSISIENGGGFLLHANKNKSLLDVNVNAGTKEKEENLQNMIPNKKISMTEETVDSDQTFDDEVSTLNNEHRDSNNNTHKKIAGDREEVNNRKDLLAMGSFPGHSHTKCEKSIVQDKPNVSGAKAIKGNGYIASEHDTCQAAEQKIDIHNLDLAYTVKKTVAYSTQKPTYLAEYNSSQDEDLSLLDDEEDIDSHAISNEFGVEGTKAFSNNEAMAIHGNTNQNIPFSWLIQRIQARNLAALSQCDIRVKKDEHLFNRKDSLEVQDRVAPPPNTIHDIKMIIEQKHRSLMEQGAMAGDTLSHHQNDELRRERNNQKKVITGEWDEVYNDYEFSLPNNMLLKEKRHLPRKHESKCTLPKGTNDHDSEIAYEVSRTLPYATQEPTHLFKDSVLKDEDSSFLYDEDDTVTFSDKNGVVINGDIDQGMAFCRLVQDIQAGNFAAETL